MIMVTRESQDVGGKTMSLAIVLGGWVAASILFSPLIGRFLSAAEESPRQFRRTQRPGPFWIRPHHLGTTAVRRNVAIELHRREAGSPRA
jgi:hypothetical protein